MATTAAAGLTLDEARAMIDRAVEKCREQGVNTSFAVVDEGGNLVSLSRVDGAPAAAVGVAQAKAYLSAILQGSSGPFSERMEKLPMRYMGYLHILPRASFAGPGGMPIMKEGRCVGAIAMSLSSGPGAGKPVPLPDSDEKANFEDYAVCYALGVPYKSQH